MRKLKKIIQVAALFALVAAQLAFPIAKAPDRAQAAQNCSLNSFYGTVTYNGVATDGITVTLADLTNAAPALTNVTSGGGMYLIESANLTTCAAAADQIQIRATYSGVTATQTVAYVAQALTNVNLALTAVVTPVLTSINVTPATASINVAANQQLTANALDQNGAAMNPQPAITWTSSDTAIASVDATGLVVGVSAGGPVTITAASGAITGTASITVTAVVIPVLTTINVTPNTPAITVGGANVQLVANALDQNGAAMNPQPAITWTSSNTAVATVDVNGLVTAVSAGTAVITATDSVSAVSGTVTVTVTAAAAPVLTTISITPAAPSILTGATSQLTANGLDQNGTAMNPQPTFTWTSATPAVATVSATGLVTGVSVGTAVITAVSGGVSGNVTVTITAAPPVLTTINLTPAPVSVIAGGTIQFSASTLDQNGTAMAPAPTLDWTSANPLIGTINASGLFTAVGIGTTTVSAANGAITGTANITVASTSPVLTVLSITPMTASLNVSDTRQFTATSTDQFGNPLFPSPALAWTSSDNGIGTISATGLFTAVAAGTVTVTASGLASTTPVNATATVTVAAPTPPAPSSGGGGGGGGGSYSTPAPTYVESVNISLVVGPSQSGKVTYHYANGTGIEIQVPADAVANTTSFSIFQSGMTDHDTPIDSAGAFLIGGQVFNISAMSGGIPVTSFNKELKISFTLLNVPDDQPDIGVYYFDPSQDAWVLIPNFSYDASNSQFTISVNHLTEFAVMRVPGHPAIVKAKAQVSTNDNSGNSSDGQVLGEKRFGDGSLLRGPDKKIYLIYNGYKVRILTLSELKKYAGKMINNVSQNELDKYPNYSGTVQGIRIFANGSLVRGEDGKIFVMISGRIVHIRSLSELRTKYRGKKINDVSQSELDKYSSNAAVSKAIITPAYNAFANGNLIRSWDGKIYVIENGTITHIKSLAELKSKYDGKWITEVDDTTLAKFMA